jgi:hypothetical protein
MLGRGRCGWETVERCLACEADGDQGDIVRHALPSSPLCIVSAEGLGRPALKAQHLRISRSEIANDRAQQTERR